MTVNPQPHHPLPQNRALRILIGTTEISGQIPDYAAGFRALGHSVTTVIRERNPMFPELEYDVDMAASSDPSLLGRLIDEHDVFVFQFGGSLLPGNLDLNLIRSAGKAVVMILNGDDARHASAYHQEYGIAPETLGDFYVNDPIARPLQTLRVAERFASLVVSVPNQAGLALRPYVHFAYPIDLSLYTARIPDNDVPIIVHAPSNRAVKGSAQILAAFENLRARGVRFELQLLEKVPNAVVRDTLRDADIAVDQLFIPYGKFAAEALASACATATPQVPHLEPLAHVRPLWAISPDALESQLEALISNRNKRRELAALGRAHVEMFHDRTVVCARLLEALKAAIRGTLRYDYYPTFAAEQYVLPASVMLSRHLRVLGSEIVAAHGLPQQANPALLTRRGLLDATTLTQSGAIAQWNPTRGLSGSIASIDTLLQRWNTPSDARNSVSKPGPPLPRDACLARFFQLTHVAGEGAEADAIAEAVTEYLRLGLPHVAAPLVLSHVDTMLAARRAAGLLFLGCGDARAAEAMLSPLLEQHDADGIVGYYHAVARILQGRDEGTSAALQTAIRKLPRTPTLLLWGSTPILTNHYWSEAMREGGADSRTLMIEYYGSINRREDFDHYLGDFTTPWTSPHVSAALAPYHAFLFTALFGKVLHTSFDGGPLQQSACAPLEPALLQVAGVKSVVMTYGGDGALYSKVRDASLRHAFQLSYPAAARREPQIAEKVTRWNAVADVIIGNVHSIDGHGRWDLLVANNVNLDLRKWQAVDRYSPNDGRNGPVRVLHSPNHRGFKGTEFLIAAVAVLREEGLQVELDLIEGVQNSEVKARLRRADILAEQFIAPIYGLSGVEGMATGLPVMANLTSTEYLQVFRRYSFLDECPIVGTTPETITANLRRLVTDPALRETLGRASRAYVEKYHSYATARMLFGAIHQRILDGDSLDLMQLFHPLRSEYVRTHRIDHPLVESRLPAEAPVPSFVI